MRNARLEEIFTEMFDRSDPRSFDREPTRGVPDTFTHRDMTDAEWNALERSHQDRYNRKHGPPRVFAIGDVIEVLDGSGILSGMRGRVVSHREIPTDGRGVPELEDGHYKPVDWDKEFAFKGSDGKLHTMFKNRARLL